MLLLDITFGVVIVSVVLCCLVLLWVGCAGFLVAEVGLRCVFKWFVLFYVW